MADVIVYPWHGLPQRYVDNSGVYTPQVSTTFDADGPMILNRYGLLERYTDNGDGTYSPLVAVSSSEDDRLILEHGFNVRYVPNGDGTYARMIATASLGGTDRVVYNVYGLAEIYVDLGDGSYAQLGGADATGATVYGPFGLAEGYGSVTGGYAIGLYGLATFALDFQRNAQYGLSPAFSHTRATASALVQQYDGSYVQMLANEWGNEGWRRVRNYRTADLTVDNNPQANSTVDNAAKTVELTQANASYSYWRPALATQPAGSKWFVRAKISCPAGERTIGFRLACSGGGADAKQAITVDATKREYTLALTLSVAGVPEFGLDNRSAVVAGIDTSVGTFTFEDPCIYEARPGQTIPDPEYVSLGVEILGAEQLTNGDFSDGLTGWTAVATTGSVTAVGGAARLTTADGDDTYIYQAITVQAGRTYRLTVDQDRAGGGASVARIGTTPGGDEYLNISLHSSGTFTGSFTATATGTVYVSVIQYEPGPVYADIDNFSFKPIVHHGWGVDGVQCFAIDEYGESLRGAELGPDLIKNGGFNADSDWAKSAQVSIAGGVLNIASSDGSFQSATQSTESTVGKLVRATVVISRVGSGQIKLSWSGDASPTANQNVPATVGTHVIEWVNNAAATSLLTIGRASGVTDIDVDSISLREVRPKALGPALYETDFSSPAGWSLTNASIAGGQLTVSPSATVSRAVGAGLVVGWQYQITYTIREITPGSSNIRVYCGSQGAGTARTAPGTYTETITCAGANLLYFFTGGGFVSGVIDDVSIRRVYPVRAAGAVRNPAITNRIRNSGDLDGTGWSSNGTATISVGSDGPFGPAERMTTAIAGNGRYQFLAQAAAGAGEPYCYSLYAKAVSGVSGLYFSIAGTAFSGDSRIVVDLATGLVTVTANNGATGGVEAVPGWPGWYRIYLHKTTNQAGSVAVVAYSHGGAGVFDIDEVNCQPTLSLLPPVPTTSAAVTADADVIALDKNEIGYSASGGVWVIEHTPAKAISADAGEQVLLDLYTSANERARVYNPSSNLGVEVVDDSVSQWSANDADANWVAGTQQRVAVRFVADDGSLVTDGTEHLTDASMTVPTVTSINLGGLAASKYSGTIERITYFAEAS